MASKTLPIDRAPVLALWAAVVAGRLGFGGTRPSRRGVPEEAFEIEIPAGKRGWGPGASWTLG